MTLKILSWNIWRGKFIDQVVDFIKHRNPDILGLQEVIEEGNSNTAKYIADKLRYEYRYAPAMKIQKNGKTIDMGNAVLSKYKIVESKAHILFPSGSRVAVQADIQINNTIAHVFCTHLIHTHQKPSSLQNLQAENLIKILPKEKTIVMGDFNATPKSFAIKKISEVLKNSDKNSSTPTWSVYKEGCEVCKPKGVICRLDYIFTSKEMEVLSFKIENSKASDHLPILTMVEV